jgi:hypothetical protein
VLQHTPSVQKPEAHWSFAEHELPRLPCCAQLVPAQ